MSEYPNRQKRLLLNLGYLLYDPLALDTPIAKTAWAIAA
ncbi:hypothetical protein OSCI_2050002 [Kamptonema sp. PCC 6506]|nr:hypothetical protein OSCI_2050002 [Kamptonema sp. PCC 6506]